MRRESIVSFSCKISTDPEVSKWKCWPSSWTDLELRREIFFGEGSLGVISPQRAFANRTETYHLGREKAGGRAEGPGQNLEKCQTGQGDTVNRSTERPQKESSKWSVKKLQGRESRRPPTCWLPSIEASQSPITTFYSVVCLGSFQLGVCGQNTDCFLCH